MKWLLHPWLVIRLQFALGAIFVIAAIPKIADPPAFAQVMANYALFPVASVHPLALALPWIEMLAGVALLVGVARRSAATLIALLLVSFIVALGINLARKHPVECGCFSAAVAQKTSEELLRDMRVAIGRDAGMLLMAGAVIASGGYRANRGDA